jgi:Na+-translocating ferredoxin:NAD+ oxidoreductase RnfG subunit
MVAAHTARLATVVAIAWLVHATHAERLARREAFDVASVSIELVRQHLPEASSLGGPSTAVGGALDVLDAAGDRIGTILRTSPAGDAVIGFSGPTDVLLVCDADRIIVGMEIRASGDTRDHVRAIERDARFLESLNGRPLAELADDAGPRVDAVAGSTLTSRAIVDAIVLRLGGRDTGSRFDAMPTLADVQVVFSDAGAIEAEPGDEAVIRVRAADGTPLGWCLRTSPAADCVIGYQGPTDAIIGFDSENKVVGVAILASFDNEPYVGYVRDDEAFRGLWRGMAVEALAGMDPADHGVEGVSGATMTSQAIAEGIVRAAREQRGRSGATGSAWRTAAAWLRGIEPPQWGAIAVVLAGVVTAFTRARGTWFGRLALPVAVLGYLGFGAGALLSLAQFAGWSQSGVPAGAVLLTILTAVAFVAPATTKRNVYCSHLCAHGAAQQLLLRVAKPKGKIPPRLRVWLTALPWALLSLAILTAVVPLPLALVDLEPFDAYLPLVAGVPALAIFAVSLAASIRYPMAYCRYGCPTGALLDHLRLHRACTRITWRDGVLLASLIAAATASWWPV